MKNILLVLVFLCLQSCVTYQKCKDKFGGDTLVTFKDSTLIKHDTIYVQADTMGGEISLEELLTNDYVKDSVRQKIVIKYKDGKIKYVNICKPQTIYKTDTLFVRQTKYVTNNFKDQNMFQKIYSKIKWWWVMLLIAVIFVTAYLINAVKK